MRATGGAVSPRRPPARTTPSLLLVSASSGTAVRDEVGAGLRPCPEYLRLQALIGADITDWSPTSALRRKSLRAATLAAVSLRRAAGCRSVLSDGEHVGLPLALGMQLTGIRTPHVMLAHRLTTAKKLAVLRHSTALGRIDRMLVHSAVQADLLRSMVDLDRTQLHVVPYGIDTDFWTTDEVPDEPLLASAGREHRDHHVLSAAVEGQPYRVFVTDSSGHSPRARRLQPASWPDNVDVGHLTYVELRALYARSSVLVVPVVPCDFPAGVTAVLEAMSMGRPVVVTDSPACAASSTTAGPGSSSRRTGRTRCARRSRSCSPRPRTACGWGLRVGPPCWSGSPWTPTPGGWVSTWPTWRARSSGRAGRRA